jgi:hypothetical protein
MIYSSTCYILSGLCISMFRLLYCSSSYFCFLKHKKTKNISVVSLYLVLWFSTFGLLYLLFSVCYLKNTKIFHFVHYFLSFLFQKSKNPKIFVVLLWFCKVCCRVQSSVTPLELGIHFILFKPHKWRAIMMIYDNPRCGNRLVWTLLAFIFLHILIHVDMRSQFM